MNILILFATLAISITVSVKDFEPALGKWKGTITYLDYTSGKPITMPCNITIRNTANEYKLIFSLEYPKEPQANGNDTLIISADGTMINDTKVVAKENKDGLLRITGEKNGVDGNDSKKALIRYVYIIGKKTFIKRKEVRFEGEGKFIMRNEFRMARE